MAPEWEGGEPACQLPRVCQDCGRFQDDPDAARCANCGASLGARSDRDRDILGRARSARPRDALGRPLPYGAPGFERQPEGIRRSPGEALDEAQRLLDRGLPFHAHEVLEDAWKATNGPDRALWKGLAQLAVGLTHAARGNPAGAAALLRRGAGYLAAYSDEPPHGVDVGGLLRWAGDLAADLDTAPSAQPRQVAAPKLRR